ncbi:MAG: OmpA family protein, partial [Bacteroidota bacterium]
PTVWAEKGFGNQLARSGQSMVGMTVYGCNKGKPHCREYVQIQLKEPLVIGQVYEVSFWVAHLPKSLQVNNIGLYFSEAKIDLKLATLIAREPQVKATEIVSAYGRRWAQVRGKFTATTEAEYVVAGNFYPDSLTQIRSTRRDAYPYAYYYLDDISVRKVPPILDVPIRSDDLTLLQPEEGKIIPLRNIYFETDEAELLPRSYVELNKLLQLMRDHPRLIIQINGHTDAQGEDEYNQSLSQKRAAAVVAFLNQNGIDSTRTLFEGYGSTRPIASNITEEGRQQNRRVELLIVSR